MFDLLKICNWPVFELLKNGNWSNIVFGKNEPLDLEQVKLLTEKF